MNTLNVNSAVNDYHRTDVNLLVYMLEIEVSPDAKSKPLSSIDAQLQNFDIVLPTEDSYADENADPYHGMGYTCHVEEEDLFITCVRPTTTETERMYFFTNKSELGFHELIDRSFGGQEEFDKIKQDLIFHGRITTQNDEATRPFTTDLSMISIGKQLSW
ncbi:hypothetical protein MTBBW1_2550011 [Desulfamplus magnetovallimortis]|uniref:Uncharacterized protein n=1 Tax=Desulfamplus magnetovallimortis TaxID=1246637 RepID=A0A1W1HEN7_9BACT|nr:hypothetical protein [Desulfamplus magnetovallimortis]SLM30957.1 hypothetical protein MTBBW1_2550011 [Desulfamplus magnetovallimortis]